MELFVPSICLEQNISERKAHEYIRIARFKFDLDERFNKRVHQDTIQKDKQGEQTSEEISAEADEILNAE